MNPEGLDLAKRKQRGQGEEPAPREGTQWGHSLRPRVCGCSWPRLPLTIHGEEGSCLGFSAESSLSPPGPELWAGPGKAPPCAFPGDLLHRLSTCVLATAPASALLQSRALGRGCFPTQTRLKLPVFMSLPEEPRSWDIQPTPAQ